MNLRSLSPSFVAVLLVGTLQACVSSEPVPELISAAGSRAKSHPVVSGPLLQECLDRSGLREKHHPAGGINYNPAITYRIAKRMHYGGSQLRSFADKILAYEHQYETNGIFGPVEHSLVCLYGLKGGDLSFTETLRPDSQGRVSRAVLDDAILVSYAKLAGKNVTATRIFGPYAD